MVNAIIYSRLNSLTNFFHFFLGKNNKIGNIKYLLSSLG